MNIVQILREQSISLKFWIQNKGLSHNDYAIIRQISAGNMKGSRGRGKELLQMLKDDGLIPDNLIAS